MAGFHHFRHFCNNADIAIACGAIACGAIACGALKLTSQWAIIYHNNSSHYQRLWGPGGGGGNPGKIPISCHMFCIFLQQKWSPALQTDLQNIQRCCRALLCFFSSVALSSRLHVLPTDLVSSERALEATKKL